MEVMEKRKGLTDLTYDQLASVRNKLSAELKVLDEQVKALKGKVEKVDTEFLRRFNTEGIQSVRTKNGTPYVLTRTTASVADREVFMDWMRQNNAFDFMNVSANKSMVTTYMEETGDLPPGINWTSKLEIGFKKS